MQQQLFKVRDLRQKTQFKIDDIYLNGYARICGVNATLVYISLCRHAEFNSQKAFPSQNKIAWEHGISTRTVKRGLKELIKHNIVIVEQEKMRGQFKNNIYILLDKSEWKKPTEGQDGHTTRGTETEGQPPPTVRVTQKDNKVLRITNKKDNKDIATPSVADKINPLIEKFKPVNPSYNQLFKNTTQRNALTRLLKEHGQEKIEWLLEVLPKTNSVKYAPTITTPLKLETKLGDLLAFIKKEGGEKRIIKL